MFRFGLVILQICLVAFSPGAAFSAVKRDGVEDFRPGKGSGSIASPFSDGSLGLDELGRATIGGPRMGALLGTSGERTSQPGRGSEFISGYYRGAVLMPVRIWGAVRQSGLHQVPTGTDLVQLITLAGGPNTDAEMDAVTIKRQSKSESRTIRVNLEELISSSEPAIELEPNDTIIIPASRPLIDQNTLNVIGVVTSVVGIVASSVLIAGQIK